MIIDTSAVLAMLLGEPDAEHYENTIARTLPRRMSVVGLLEAAIVLESRGVMAAADELDLFLQTAEIELAAVTAEQARSARRA